MKPIKAFIAASLLALTAGSAVSDVSEVIRQEREFMQMTLPTSPAPRDPSDSFEYDAHNLPPLNYSEPSRMVGDCERKPEPDWFRELPVFEFWRMNLAQAIYKKLAYDRVLRSGDCSCENYHPDWEEATELYMSLFAHLTHEQHLEMERAIANNRRPFQMRLMDTCRAAGRLN